jgi:hypothetical protein
VLITHLQGLSNCTGPIDITHFQKCGIVGYIRYRKGN